MVFTSNHLAGGDIAIMPIQHRSYKVDNASSKPQFGLVKHI